MRTTVLLFLLTAPSALAQEEKADEATQVDWAPGWEDAFAEARKSGKPVMICINSKDKEVASERAAKQTYRDPGFVRLSRRFVMLVVSTHMHWPKGECPRFGKITCRQHQDCHKDLAANHGEQFYMGSSKGSMISPQHAWFGPDGTLLRRKEYELTRKELIERMHAVLKEVTGKSPTDEGADAGSDHRDAPLTEKEKGELERARTAGKEPRRAALGNLLATEKTDAIVALIELLETAKAELECDILRAFGRARVADARETVEAYLSDRDPLVRSFAAVALEGMGMEGSVAPLVKRARKERDSTARKNMFRALGVCGGPVASKEAAKALLKAMNSDKQTMVRKHAVIAMKAFKGEKASKLVLKKLEKAALKVKDRSVRGAITYTLAHIGNKETTLPVFNKLLEDFKRSNNELGVGYMRAARRVLKGEGSGFSGLTTYWLFREDRDDPARED